MKQEHQDKFKGNELTCKDILYHYRMGDTNDSTTFRLILERLEYLEEFVSRVIEVNNLKEK